MASRRMPNKRRLKNAYLACSCDGNIHGGHLLEGISYYNITVLNRIIELRKITP
jgi:hypothetical protein